VLQDYSQEPGHLRSEENRLTERERQVLRLIIEGRSNKEIGAELGISPKTVSVHRTNVMAKLDVQTTVELLRFVEANPVLAAPFTEASWP
jgi:DNA-binding CsgD family transcriptional regulator